MFDKEAAQELIRKMEQNPVEAQTRAAFAACVASEMRAGRDRDEATMICYIKMRAKAEGKPCPSFDTNDPWPWRGKGTNPSPDQTG